MLSIWKICFFINKVCFLLSWNLNKILLQIMVRKTIKDSMNVQKEEKVEET